MKEKTLMGVVSEEEIEICDKTGRIDSFTAGQ